MSFNPDKAKQVQGATVLRKVNECPHQPIYCKNATVKPTHALKQLCLQLDKKLTSSDHTNNKIITTTKH